MKSVPIPTMGNYPIMREAKEWSDRHRNKAGRMTVGAFRQGLDDMRWERDPFSSELRSLYKLLGATSARKPSLDEIDRTYLG